MSDQTTNTVGYYNPHGHPVFFEVSELNLKIDLPPSKYIMDLHGNLINDPIFDAYCHPKGLARATTDQLVPVRLVPRPEVSVRPRQAVTQAVAFVRQPTGTVAPVYSPQQQQVMESPINKNPVIGMTVEKARQIGLIGKPRLVPEDYGADESTGAPERGKKLPDIKLSIESPPRIRTAAPLNPAMMQAEAEDFQSPQEIARRQQLAQALNTGAAAPSPAQFDPNKMRGPSVNRAPIPMRPPEDDVVGIAGATQIAPAPAERVEPVRVQPEPLTEAPPPPPQPAPQPPVRTRRPAPAPAPKRTTVVQASPVEAALSESIQIQPEQQPPIEVEAEPVGEAGEEEGTFVCSADGRHFKYRSELERHVRRHFPHIASQLMEPYPK